MRAWIVAATACAVAGCGGSREAGAGAQGGTPAAQAAAVPAPNAQQPAAAPAGQAVYSRTCIPCHQANGRGLPGAFPPLAASPFVNGQEAKLIRLVLNGLTGPVTVQGQRYNSVMPPWKGQLSDAEIAAVLTYVRSSFGNTSGPVAADAVQRERAATASRSAPWTVQDLDRLP